MMPAPSTRKAALAVGTNVVMLGAFHRGHPQLDWTSVHPFPNIVSRLCKRKKPRALRGFLNEQGRDQAAALSCFSGRAIALSTLNW